jgi:hypothetical protein
MREKRKAWVCVPGQALCICSTTTFTASLLSLMETSALLMTRKGVPQWKLPTHIGSTELITDNANFSYMFQSATIWVGILIHFDKWDISPPTPNFKKNRYLIMNTDTYAKRWKDPSSSLPHTPVEYQLQKLYLWKTLDVPRVRSHD